MANLFQKIAQKAKDVAVGAYHQVARNDNGQDLRSYMDEQERRRKLEQQQAAQRAQQQLAARSAQSAPNTGLTVKSAPTPRLSISQPQAQPSGIRLAPAPAVPQIKVPVTTPPKAPLPDMQFKAVSEGAGKNKTVFGKNAAWLLPKSLEKTYQVKADRTISTNKDKFVAEFDQLHPDYQKVLVAEAQKGAAKGDQASINTLKALEDSGRMKGGFTDFVEGSNERLYGGTARGLMRGVDFALPGHNTFGLEQLADEQDVPRQFTDRGKQGEKVGTVQKGIVDVASLVLPGAGIDKGVAAIEKANDTARIISIARELGMNADEAARLVQSGVKIVDEAGKLTKFGEYVAKTIPSSVAGSVIDAFQTKGRGDDVNVAKSTGVGLATDLVAPVVLKPLGKVARKGLNMVADKFAPKAVDKLVDEGLKFADIRDGFRASQSADEAAARELVPDVVETGVRKAEELAAEQADVSRRVEQAIADNDPAALAAAKQDLERLGAQVDQALTQQAPTATVPAKQPTVAPTTPNVNRPLRTVAPSETIVPVPKVETIDDIAARAPTEAVDNALTPAVNQTEDVAQLSLQDKAAALEERMLTDPSPETQDALDEARREIAGREAAVANNSVASTPNQDLVNAGLVNGDIQYAPIDGMKIGREAMGETDPSTVAAYRERIRNGEVLDPVVVTRDADGQIWVQDGKHRLQAMQEEGVQNAPIVMKTEAVDPGIQARIDKFKAERAAITDPADPKAVQLDKTIERLEGQANGTPTPKERGFVSSVKSNPDTVDEVKQGIDGSSYDPITNEDSLKAADDIIAADPEAAIQRAKNEQQYGTEVQAVSMRLIDQLQAAGRYDDAIDVVEATAKRATEAGQATQILAAYNRLSPEGILAAAQREINNAAKLDPAKYGKLKITPEQAQTLREMAEKVAKMADGTPEKAKATRELLNELSRTVPTPGIRKVTTLWKAGLLTGVKGAVAGNTVGNSAAAIMRKIADVPAAAIDTVLAQLTGKRSKVFTLKGLFGGFVEGLKVGAKNLKEGIGAEAESIKLDYNKVNFSKSKLGRAAQKYTDSVFNFYSAADRPFYHAALKNNLEELARVEAKNQGLRGKEAKALIKQIMSEPPDDILTAAVASAEDATFQNKNALGAALSGAKRGLASKGAAGEAVGELVMPFTGVPAAIAKHVYDYSPAGAVVNTYKAIKNAATGNFDQAAQRALSESLGKAITGTGVIWLGTQLHNDGIMTLGWPSDPKERTLWEAEGKQPYSVKIGGKWRSMNYMGSLMSLMAIGGQINQAKQDGSSGVGAITQGVAGSAKAIVGSTPLQGVQGALDAVNEPERNGEKYVQGLAGSVVPTIVKDIAVAGDDKQRQVNSIADAVQSRIPGARNDLPAKVDMFGNDMTRPNSAAGTIVDPFKSSTAKDTPVTIEMRRLQDAKSGVNPPTIDKKTKFDGVETELTPEQMTTLVKNTGQQVQKAWNATIATPEYQALSDEDKAKALSNIASDYAAVERRKFAATNSLGQYAQDFTGTPAKLSGKQDAILQNDGNFDPANYVNNIGDTKLNGKLSSSGKQTLSKIEAMTTTARTDYLKDPKNNYAYQIAKFENDFKNGGLSDVDQYNKVQELGKLKVQSNYSAEANELYGLSEKKLADFIAKKGGVSQKVMDEVLAMDAQLAAEGYISKAKFAGGVGGSGSGKKAKVPRPSFGSFGLVSTPNTPHATMQSVMSDLNKAFADIKVLQGLQVAPGQDSSSIKLSTI